MAEQAGAEILRVCVEVGGCLTGEHGVGVEKRDLMEDQYAGPDLAAQMDVKDVFDPGGCSTRPRSSHCRCLRPGATRPASPLNNPCPTC